MAPNSSSEYDEILQDLHGQDKLDVLDVIQMGEEKLKELQKRKPLLFSVLRLFKNSPKHRPMVKEFVAQMAQTHRAMKEYLDVRLEMSKSIQKLPAKGWYLSLDFIDALAISNLDEYLERDPIAFQTDVEETFSRQFLYIEGKLMEDSPKRADLIKNIFSLHTQGNYFAAIPLALTQADGFCKDWFTVESKSGKHVPVGFFDMDRDHKRGTASQKLSRSIIAPATSVFNLLLNQLAKIDRNNSLVLEGNTSRLSDLNRHAILHGESTDYGTKINSIKAILLLDFIDALRISNSILKEKLKSTGT
ncbi:hypothetical protein [Puia sp.]|jgi:hypothetical protein|uniref:hypothetical protein n=1 Tax=Puia sp. TaxID=2045100 RepID=UPI002F40E9F0